MKPQFEISKNGIIVFLVSFICALGSCFILYKIIDSVKRETSQTENTNCEYIRIAYEEAINYLQDENAELVESKDSISHKNVELKKKVDYYFEFYRKNQPVGIEVESDTVISQNN